MSAEAIADRPTRHYVLAGIKASFSVPALVLFGSFLGFGGLARELGWPVTAAMLSTIVVWAAPGQLILLGTLGTGAGAGAALIATTISAVRLLPMTVSLTPILRGPRTRLWQEILASHYIAVTAWTEAMRLTPELPREGRMPFFFAMSNALVLWSTIATGLGHVLAATLPPALAIALLMLTPIYFTLSLERGAKSLGDRLAIPLGLVLAPAITSVAPGFELVGAGVIGGLLAFALDRASVRRKGV